LTGIKIAGTGSYLPEFELTNELLETIVETNDEWITSRTGIKSRRTADGETNLFMSTASCKSAIENAGIDKKDIAAVICATFTNDYYTPSVACLLQRDLGLNEGTLAFDLNAACSGFLYGMHTAYSLLRNTPDKYALVVGTDLVSNVLDYTDRSTCILFGDGSGAAVIGLDKDSPYYFTPGSIGNDTSLYCPSNVTPNNPFRKNKRKSSAPFIFMEGSEVFKFAVESIKKCISQTLAAAGVAIGEIDHFVLHQANGRIIATAAKRLGAPIEKFFMNIGKYGNTSAASIPIALAEMNQNGMFRRGDKVVACAFGGGLTYGASYFTF
jgi:3-oxoacyl-[acyl-carrier-protein] synthase-3